MQFLHTMLRVHDLDKTLTFFTKGLGLIVTRQKDHQSGRFSLIFLATAKGEPEIELTHNWDNDEPYDQGRFFGHLAFEVDNIYETCSHLQSLGITINRPPKEGRMAFVKSPDGISIELLQKGEPLVPCAPWNEMENIGSW